MTTTAPTVTVVVPGMHLMAELLGQRDELLRRVEESFPDVSVVVRGNEIHCAGPRAHQVGKLFEEMVLLHYHLFWLKDNSLRFLVTWLLRK